MSHVERRRRRRRMDDEDVDGELVEEGAGLIVHRLHDTPPSHPLHQVTPSPNSLKDRIDVM